MARLKTVFIALGFAALASFCGWFSFRLASGWAREIDGSVIAVRTGKQPEIDVATPSGEESLPFDRDEAARCPKGARFHKDAFSAALRCDGRRVGGFVDGVLWWFGIVMSAVFALGAGAMARSTVQEAMRGRRPGRAR